MLQATSVLLTADLSVESARRRLDGYSDRARVILRRALGPSVYWYLFTAPEIRDRLDGRAGDRTLEDVLDLKAVNPARSMTCRVMPSTSSPGW